jgi:hypothetical protein
MIRRLQYTADELFASHSSPADAALYKSLVIVAFWTAYDLLLSVPLILDRSFPRPALCTSHRRPIYLVGTMNLSCHFSTLKDIQNLASIQSLGSFNFFDASKSFDQCNCGAKFSTHATTSSRETCLLLTVITPSVKINSLRTALFKPHRNNVEGSSSMRAAKYSPRIDV